MSFAAKIILKDFDINLLTKLLTHQLEYVTCLECCKYYSAPVTAECGHTLCTGCWYGRRNCPVCAITVLKKNQKLNLPLQNLTEHVCTLIQSFEKLFNVKLADLDLELQNTDTNKNVTNWLQNSQNKFSAPISNVSTQDLNPHVEYLTSEAQIHTTKVIPTHQTKEDAVRHPQDDWDKIEVLDDDYVKNKENVNVKTMDIDENELTLVNPRRSNRKKVKTSEVTKQANKTKQTWNHAKKMRQEFNRLNKENRNKLNVSVETVKKPEVSCSKPLLVEKHNLSNNTTRNITANESSKETEQDNNLCTTPIVNQDTVSSNQNSEQKTAKSLECGISNQTHSNIGNKNNTSIDSGNPCDIGDVMSPKVKFFKKGALHVTTKEVLQTSDNDQTKTSDDVVITITVGKVITNVCIKQNESNPQIKIHTNRAVQTSLGHENVNNATRNNVTITEVASTQLNSTRQQKTLSNKKNSASQSHILISDSTKKNTASADTRTAQYEAACTDIELIEMECVENRENTTQIQKGDEKSLSFQKENILEEMEGFNDIFDCDFPKSESVQALIASKNVPSTILVPTQSKSNRTQVDKRLRSLDYDELPLKKKQRLYTENVTIRSASKVDYSECSNYDNVMEKVFANIDADIGIIQSGKELAKPLNNKENSTKITQVAFSQSQSNRNKNFDRNQKDSENLFSNCDNDVITQTNKLNTQRKLTNVSHNEAMTPNLCREYVSTEEEKEENREDNMDIELGTPLNDDSDVSIVEETPQKNVSNLKVKLSAISSNLDNDISKQSDTSNRNLKATVKNKISSENTDTKKVKNSIITPLTINKFVEQIQHKSTPVAKKSLNFNIKNVQDAEETLCKSLLMEQETTQEKEFMNEVFQVASSPEFESNIVLRDRRRKVEVCVAGTCLLAKQTSELRQLCSDRGWRFVDEYTHDVTHLVIEVDEQNKCKRSLKYMRALAAGKWIIGFSWVEKCIQTGTVAPEEGFECLDMTGEPGPRRSRLDPRRLFSGITFFCMPPITMLDHHMLHEIIASAGGRVASEMSEVRLEDGAPGLVLAEPDHTQDSKYQYLAMDVGIVPVHCEWALNCLGQYALAPLEAPLLLCSPTLLQPRLHHWPPRLRDLVQ